MSKYGSTCEIYFASAPVYPRLSWGKRRRDHWAHTRREANPHPRRENIDPRTMAAQLIGQSPLAWGKLNETGKATRAARPIPTRVGETLTLPAHQRNF